MLAALFLVMAGLSYGTSRTTVNTFPTGSISIKETIVVMSGVEARGWLKRYLCHYRPDTHRFSLGGDKAVTETEGSKPGRIGGMTFRPG